VAVPSLPKDLPRTFALSAVAVAVAAGLLGSAVGGTGGAVVLVLLQVLGLGLWLWLGSAIGRGWATATFVVGAAWALLFLVPSAVYAVSPRYLPGLNATGAIAVVDTALFALLAGAVLSERGRPRRAPLRVVRVRATPIVRGAAVVWFALGLLGLVGLMLHAGGPAAYVSNLDQTAGLNSGLFYVVWLALAVRFAPSAVAFLHWSRGERLGRVTIACVVIGIGLLLLTGARSFIAVGAAQLLLASALLRGGPSLRRIAPAAVIGGLLLVFGLGTIKRHQSYNAQHPDAPLSLATYAVDVAPATAVDAYVNNYVDTVRLVAIARAVVPSMAPYETVRPLELLALKPLPSGIRPDVPRDPAITRVFEPGGGSAYAEPLQVTAFLAGGPIAVAFAFALLGFAIARLDRWLAAPVERSPAVAAGAIALCVQIPVMIRSGLPNGFAFLAVEVLGTAAVTWSVAGGRFRDLRPRRRVT
jgi:hypothetical protein